MIATLTRSRFNVEMLTPRIRSLICVVVALSTLGCPPPLGGGGGESDLRPTVPGAFSANAVSCTQVNLSWAASTDKSGMGLAGYRVYRDGALLQELPATSTSDNVAEASSHDYAVSSLDNAGTESLKT